MKMPILGCTGKLEN